MRIKLPQVPRLTGSRRLLMTLGGSFLLGGLAVFLAIDKPGPAVGFGATAAMLLGAALLHFGQDQE